MKQMQTAIVALALVMTGAPAAANLLVNPTIAGSLAPWAGVGVFDPGNSHTADGSGSILASLSNSSGVNTSIGAGTSQCVAGISAGASYFFGGFVSLAPPAPGTQQGGAVVNAQWFSDNACATFITQTATFGPTTQDTPLNTYVQVAHVQVAPLGALSALVVTSVLNNEPGPSTFAARFDDLFFQVAPVFQAPLQVPTVDLRGMLALGAALAMGALWALRRRRQR